MEKQFLIRKDCKTTLLLYANLFNHLLENNLDLELKHHPIVTYNMDLEGISSEDLIKIRQDSLYREQRRIYLNFISLKQNYDAIICEQFRTNNKATLEKEIDKIVNSGLYPYPKKLKYMLLISYDDLMQKVDDNIKE